MLLLGTSSLALSLALLPLPLPLPLPLHPPPLLVDDDRVQCPNARYTTIQSAVDAAAPGDTIRVCAGLYPEKVRVVKRLTLLGAKAGSDARQRRLGDGGESVVRSAIPFLLDPRGVTLDGFTIIADSGGGPTPRGILIAASGGRILNNVIDHDEAIGIIPRFTEESPSRTLIKGNHFYGRFGVVADPDDNDAGTAGNLLITDNLFRNARIVVTRDGSRNVDILRNRMIHDPQAPSTCVNHPTNPCHPAIVASETEQIVVQGNVVKGAGAHAIRLRDVRDVAVTDNMLRDGLGRGIFISGTADTLINGNRIAGFAGWGLLLEENAGTKVEANEIEDNHGGLAIHSASFNEVLLNNIEDNASYGIDVIDASNNRIGGNEVRGNAILDCRDQTSGPGSFGTANTWVNNEGSRSQPAQLCVDG